MQISSRLALQKVLFPLMQVSLDIQWGKSILNKSLYHGSPLASLADTLKDYQRKRKQKEKSLYSTQVYLKKYEYKHHHFFLPSSLCPCSMESLQNGKDRIWSFSTSFTAASVSPNSKLNFCHPKGIAKSRGGGEESAAYFWRAVFQSMLFGQTGSPLNRHSTDSGFRQPPA